jgi:hypothetical protein
MQHFDGWNTLEGRHLVYVYAFVIIVQLGYFAYVAANWLKLRNADTPPTRKQF